MYRSRCSSRYFKKRLEWTGHMVRMDQGRAVKKFDSKLGGSRTTGRPRLRWLEDVEKGTLEMKFKRWGQKAEHL
jgi:hypothetical protein